MDKNRIKEAVREILIAIGEDPEREGLKETPRRISEMYEEIFSGINTNAKEQLNTIFVEDDHNEMVLIKDIPFYSVCEHHFLPFYGLAHIAYIPKNGKITGLSKFARLVDLLAKKPQLQERLTSEVVEAIMEKLSPLGAIVVIEAEHMCMTMRGIKKPGSKTVTSAVRGIMKTDIKTRTEVLSLINSK